MRRFLHDFQYQNSAESPGFLNELPGRRPYKIIRDQDILVGLTLASKIQELRMIRRKQPLLCLGMVRAIRIHLHVTNETA